MPTNFRLLWYQLRLASYYSLCLVPAASGQGLCCPVASYTVCVQYVKCYNCMVIVHLYRPAVFSLGVKTTDKYLGRYKMHYTKLHCVGLVA